MGNVTEIATLVNGLMTNPEYTELAIIKPGDTYNGRYFYVTDGGTVDFDYVDQPTMTTFIARVNAHNAFRYHEAAELVAKYINTSLMDLSDYFVELFNRKGNTENE